MLTFRDNGELGAQAGCNHMGGAGRIDGDVLMVEMQFMTELACDEPAWRRRTGC
jgi:heat shock protein HslJ